MIKKIILSLFTVIVLAVIFSIYTPAHTNAAGPPTGYSGAPGDLTCAAGGTCHGGSAIAQTGWITSNVPVSGYLSGSTYSFTATATVSGITKFGFQISPQKSGQYKGTLIVTQANATQIVGSTKKYIEHKSTGTAASPTGTRSWSFDWTAPAAGTGSVTFYGAFNATDASATSSGDQIYTSTLLVTEDPTSGIADVNTKNNIDLFPNPVIESTKISMTFSETSNTRISAYDINGRLIKVFYNELAPMGNFSTILPINGTLTAGTYFIVVEHNNNRYIEKLIVL
jgi:hypothetical protein